MAKERAQKIIAQSGLMSRRKAEEAIATGRVSLNGTVFTEMGILVDPTTDELRVDGERVEQRTIKRTFLFYKPRGIVTTKSDEHGRETVMKFFQDVPSVNPVGRLDQESEGLLLMSEDGELLLKLTHPRYGVEKTYQVVVVGDPAFSSNISNLCERLATGIQLEDGAGKFDSIEALDLPLKQGITAIGRPVLAKFKVIVSEGRNRFIRRMFAAVGLEVIELKRVQMGEYVLGTLQPGERREV